MSATTTTVRPQGGLVQLVTNTLSIARRNLLHIKATPEQLVEMSIQPIMFLTLFVFVFGGAIAGSSQQYLQFALPGSGTNSPTIYYGYIRTSRSGSCFSERERHHDLRREEQD